MSYKGQPVPSTVHQSYRAKVSDGKSVRVTVPANIEVVSQRFYLIGGFFGAATESVKTGASETAEVILTIEQAEYETDQIVTTESFAAGTSIYWDESSSKFTEDDTDTRLVGRVTTAKDANNVIWFLLGPQV